MRELHLGVLFVFLALASFCGESRVEIKSGAEPTNHLAERGKSMESASELVGVWYLLDNETNSPDYDIGIRIDKAGSLMDVTVSLGVEYLQFTGCRVSNFDARPVKIQCGGSKKVFEISPRSLSGIVVEKSPLHYLPADPNSPEGTPAQVPLFKDGSVFQIGNPDDGSLSDYIIKSIFGEPSS